MSEPSRHPKDDDRRAWGEFLTAVANKDPKANCQECGETTLLSFRSGYCARHFPAPFIVHTHDWLPNGKSREIDQQTREWVMGAP